MTEILVWLEAKISGVLESRKAGRTGWKGFGALVGSPSPFFNIFLVCYLQPQLFKSFFLGGGESKINVSQKAFRFQAYVLYLLKINSRLFWEDTLFR